MSQPIWTFVTNLGDASPIEHGGIFLYKDETGVYPDEIEIIESIEEVSPGKVLIYRVCLDQYKMVEEYLVPSGYDDSWPFAACMYQSWFVEDLHSIADTVYRSYQELIDGLCSNDGKQRAMAYQNIAAYWGWADFDDYPQEMTKKKAEKRYKVGVEL